MGPRWPLVSTRLFSTSPCRRASPWVAIRLLLLTVALTRVAPRSFRSCWERLAVFGHAEVHASRCARRRLALVVRRPCGPRGPGLRVDALLWSSDPSSSLGEMQC